jgi:hypothetical protein
MFQLGGSMYHSSNYSTYPVLTLTVTNYDRKVSIELPSDSDASEVLEACMTLMTGLTFQHESIEDVICAKAEEIAQLRGRDI